MTRSTFAFRDERGLRASIGRRRCGPDEIPCPGCGAPCDRDAIGDHDEDCPLYGADAPQGPDHDPEGEA
jgi:hypothetical protein